MGNRMNKHLKGFLVGTGATALGAFMLSWFIIIIVFIGNGFDDSNLRNVGYGIGLLILFGGFTGFLCSFEDDKETGHKCDICGENLKKGEGEHREGYKEKGVCYCVCPRCLPTVKN